MSHFSNFHHFFVQLKSDLSNNTAKMDQASKMDLNLKMDQIEKMDLNIKNGP